MRRTHAVLAGVVFGLTVLVELVAVVLAWGLLPYWDSLGYAVQNVAVAGAGALIAANRPRNPIGWLFLGLAGSAVLLDDLPQGYGLRGAEGWPGAHLAEVVGPGTWAVGGVALVLIFLLFPDGRLPDPRWRVLPWVAGVSGLVAMTGWLLSPDRAAELVGGTNPLAAPGVPTDALFAVGGSVFGASLVASVVALLLRFRSSRGVLRQQLKWFVLASTVIGTVLPLSMALWNAWTPVRPLAALALVALPVGAYIGIVRHRLYDIDLLINQTAVYAVLTLLLAATYAVTAVMLGARLGHGSPWTTAGATLVVAVAFRPLRDQVQVRIDRRFRRSRFDAAERLAEFNESLRCGASAPEDVQKVLAEVLEDPGLEIVYPDHAGYVDSSGARVDPDLAGRRLTTVARSGQVLGAVLHREMADSEKSLVSMALDAAGLAIEMSRLRVDLRRQLAEVQASRQRIVEAGNEERRRLERNLHDGAQQRLMSVGLALRHAQHELERGRTGELGGTLDRVVGDIADTIAELRRLARGLPPPQLDAGLAPALRELSARSPVPVQLTAPAERFDQTLEAAAYFIGCEGVTNAVRHAHATRIELSAGRRNGSLIIRVADDGVGGADPAAGSGLRGLADRVAAMGGTIVVESAPLRGTSIVAELPCGS